MQKQIIHHVFFWLKNASSIEDRDQLIEGLKTLGEIETVRNIHIGVPASTEPRPVVETTYSVSELLFFDDLGGQAEYQEHPIHKKFIEHCSHLWERVIVLTQRMYDILQKSKAISGIRLPCLLL